MGGKGGGEEVEEEERLEVKSSEIPRSTQSDRKGQLEAPGKFSPRPTGHANANWSVQEWVDWGTSQVLCVREYCAERED
jgi:hypothetical protein